MTEQWMRVYEVGPGEQTGLWVPVQTPVTVPVSVTVPAQALSAEAPVWLAVTNPSKGEITELAELFHLPHLAVQDTLRGDQRPKVVDYDHVRFVVLRPAMLTDGEVQVGEVHLYSSAKLFLSVTLAVDGVVFGPEPEVIERRLQTHARHLGTGTGALLFATIDEATDSYGDLVEDLEEVVDGIEEGLFALDQTVPRRIYELMRDVNQLQRAIHPLPAVLGRIAEETKNHGGTHRSTPRAHLHHVVERVQRVATQVDSLRDVLTSAMSLFSALQSQRQNEQMAQMTQAAYRQSVQAKKVSAWAAILFTPTVIAGVYGMNFHTMPELSWQYGYPMAVGLMLLSVLTLYVVFKKQRWL